jgi:cell division protein FtsB
MTDQHYFETAETARRSDHPGCKLSILAKHQAQNEARKQREIEIKRRAATQLRTMIVTLEREVANLDDGISSELMLARVRDPSHFAYPISVRTMHARRENLKATIAVLSDRLALIDDAATQTVAAA